MSLFLVQVGKSTWVDPDAIQAIEWNQMSDCPTLLLGGQQRVNAYNFKHMASAETPNDAEAGTTRRPARTHSSPTSERPPSNCGSLADGRWRTPMGDVLTEVRFWAQVLTDAKRTVLCPPDLESRCKGYVDARGLSHLITVTASQFVPDGRLYVMDEGAIQAELNRPRRRAQ